MDEKGLSKQVSGASDQFFPAPRIEHLVSASATRRKFDSGPLKVRFHLLVRTLILTDFARKTLI